MDAKISLTTKCNAKCRTCPVWQKPGETISFERFKELWDRMMLAPMVNRVLLNNTGDLYNIPDNMRYLLYIEQHRYKFTVMTTNAQLMGYVPSIDHLIISFNGGNKKTYEHTTGLPFDEVVQTIKRKYPLFSRVGQVELHCLIWDGNEGSEADLQELWADFPGRVRLSYKYDNQMKEDHTLKQYQRKDRIPCDYLDMLSIHPDGKVISCAHDFDAVTDFGNVFSDPIALTGMHPERIRKKQEHLDGIYSGICEKCNYNTPDEGKIVYIK